MAADHTLLLEPYLVCFCLLGSSTLFARGRLATGRRIFVAGLLFGFALEIKLWAIFPIIAALCCCLVEWRRALRPYVAGLLIAAGVPLLPFLVAAPRALIHDVVAAQLTRAVSELAPISVGDRLEAMSGISGLAGAHVGTTTVLLAAIALAIIVLGVFAATLRTCTVVDFFVLLGTAMVVAGMFLPGEFYDHYAYFPAVFVAMLLGVCAGRLSALLVRQSEQVEGRWVRPVRVFARLAVPVSAILLFAVTVPSATESARLYLAAADDPAPGIAAHIPPGACVLSDDPILLITADRIVPDGQGCPAVVDPFGMWLTEDHGALPHFADSLPPAFVNQWRTWLERADYVVLSVQQSSYIPWSRDLVTWFNASYDLVSAQPHAYVYRRIASAVPSAQSLVDIHGSPG
ncbi:MAG TPA: hypothetical protein VHS54_02960 [Jatrophihabitans sp.]|nr:hypothetical protein [Jatrophihabitans sp.]